MKIEPADRPAKYPSLTINLPHLRNNVRVIRELCESRGIHITAVTKVFEGDPRIAQVLVEEGLTTLGDSRVDNLEFMKDVQAKDKWLIRPPMLSEIPRLVKYGTASLNSELAVIEAINAECGKQGKRHKIILMADLGDIREGYVDADELIEAARLDTGSTLKIIWHIIVPTIRPGIICAWVLSFTEQWNAVAEPIILMETREKYPLAILLNEIQPGDVLGFAATLMFFLAPLLLFSFFEDEVMEGLGDYGLK